MKPTGLRLLRGTHLYRGGVLQADRARAKILDGCEEWGSEGPEPCWVWCGSLDDGGYATVTSGRRGRVKLHRIAYEVFVGPIPEGMHVDHVKARGCNHRACVNPAHLEPVTPRENALRGDGPSGVAARATECPAGHPYDETNTRVDARGHRICRICRREVDRRYRANRRSAA